MATEKMPAWPKAPGKQRRKDALLAAYGKFQQARAEAAIARLKVAVEALRNIGGRVGIDGYPDDVWCVKAREALSLIGEIPEEK